MRFPRPTCRTEIGAESLCVAQTLIRTCLLHGVHPREYLIDVLQRMAIERKQGDDVSDLIPRIWKDSFEHRAIKCPSITASNKIKK